MLGTLSTKQQNVISIGKQWCHHSQESKITSFECNRRLHGLAQVTPRGFCHSVQRWVQVAVCGSLIFLILTFYIGQEPKIRLLFSSVNASTSAHRCKRLVGAVAVVRLSNHQSHRDCLLFLAPCLTPSVAIIARVWIGLASSDHSCLGKPFVNSVRLLVYQVFSKMTLIISLPIRVASGNRGSKYFEIRSKRSW